MCVSGICGTENKKKSFRISLSSIRDKGQSVDALTTMFFFIHSIQFNSNMHQIPVCVFISFTTTTTTTTTFKYTHCIFDHKKIGEKKNILSQENLLIYNLPIVIG